MQFRTPDYVSYYAENKKHKVFTFATEMTDGDVRIAVNGTKLFLCAQDTPVKYVRLRWNFTEQEKRHDGIKIMGDFFECQHGILGWRPIIPDRYIY